MRFLAKLDDRWRVFEEKDSSRLEKALVKQFGEAKSEWFTFVMKPKFLLAEQLIDSAYDPPQPKKKSKPATILTQRNRLDAAEKSFREFYAHYQALDLGLMRHLGDNHWIRILRLMNMLTGELPLGWTEHTPPKPGYPIKHEGGFAKARKHLDGIPRFSRQARDKDAAKKIRLVDVAVEIWGAMYPRDDRLVEKNNFSAALKIAESLHLDIVNRHYEPKSVREEILLSHNSPPPDASDVEKKYRAEIPYADDDEMLHELYLNMSQARIRRLKRDLKSIVTEIEHAGVKENPEHEPNLNAREGEPFFDFVAALIFHAGKDPDDNKAGDGWNARTTIEAYKNYMKQT